MTAIRDRYEGDFLDGTDLPERALVKVTIEAIADPDSEKDSQNKAIDKAILRFKGHAKRLILNRTNYKVLKAMFGMDAAKWVGKEIHLQRRYLNAFGNPNELCIRIIPPVGTPIPKTARDFMGRAVPVEEKT